MGPGESITYRWYIDQDFGSANLWDMADIRNHRHHGAFGMLIAEPRGSEVSGSNEQREVSEHWKSGYYLESDYYMNLESLPY